jgi:hypothetical protein
MPESDNLPEPYHKGIPIEKLIEYKSKGLSNADIAKIVGIDQSGVSRRIKSIAEDIDNTKLFQKHRSSYFAFKSREILQAITSADILKAGLRDKVVAASILFDKERLESGKSTQNIAYLDMIKAKDRVGNNLEAIEAQLVDNGVDLEAADACGQTVSDNSSKPVDNNGDSVK